MTVVLLICLATGSAAGLGTGLVSCGATRPPTVAPATRPVTAGEARLLSVVREHNFQDGYAGFRATITASSGDVHVVGWIDWRRPMIYFNSVAATPGPADGLVQATPGLVAAHPGRLADSAGGVGRSAGGTRATTGARDPYPMPPVTPPAEGWRVRRLVTSGPAGSAFDTLLGLLFSIASRKADNAPALAAAGARFVRQDLVGGVPVSVIDGPPVPTPATWTTPSPAASHVRYWLDPDGRLRRLDALLTAELPVRVDLDRGDHTRPGTIELLGGQPNHPRPVTAGEARLLADMPLRDHAAGGGRAAVTLPVEPVGLVSGAGWVDWRAPSAYLGVHDLDDPNHDGLVQADQLGVSMRKGTHWAGRPPLTPPTGGWQSASWQQRSAAGASDLDILLNTALTLTGTGTDSAAQLRHDASYLRRDAVGGVPVTVFEIRATGESRVAAGHGRMRYWLDGSGTLRRLEVRTGLGAYAYLDITPGPVPALPRV